MSIQIVMFQEYCYLHNNKMLTVNNNVYIIVISVVITVKVYYCYIAHSTRNAMCIGQIIKIIITIEFV